ncbi:MAG: T9SS type A sorting domain-containing protein, partial [Flavobacteriales bacterium]|nr:T9SS type A sorting domain-containing protein [Flavobacteriales bacterium]
PEARATTCAGATVLAHQDYAAFAITCGGTNDITGSNTAACGSSSYRGGLEAVYTFTALESGSASFAYSGQPWSGLFLFAGCPTSGGTCVANINNGSVSKTLITTITNGVTYFLVIDTWPSPASPCPGNLTIDLPDLVIPCSGTPTPGNTTGPAAVPVGGTASLGLQNATIGTGVTYQWYVSTTSGSGPWSPVGPNASTYNATVSVDSWFYCDVTCTEPGGGTGSSNVLAVQALSVTLVPQTGNNTVPCGTDFILQDSGGSGNYAASSTGYTVIEAGTGATINIAGSYNTESGFDFIRIYDGVGIGGTLLATYAGSGAVNYTGTAGQTLTVRFTSDGSVQYAGFDFTVTFTGTCYLPCSGVPNDGTASGPATVCSGSTAALSATGLTAASGINYQWEESPDGLSGWGDVVGGSGATTPNYTSTAVLATRYFRIRTICTAGPDTAWSNVVTVGVIGAVTPAVYDGISYTESFESWVNGCGTTDRPSASWNNDPYTGYNSWRRNDQGASAAWSSSSGMYTPASSNGAYSARFHTWDAASGTKGILDLFIDMSAGSGTENLVFDVINTSGTDVLKVFESSDGGGSFTQLGANIGVVGSWTGQTRTITSTAANTVIRFEATSDWGTTDIGLDNLRILPCTPATAGSQTIVPACGTNEYYIDVNLTSLGSSTTIDLTNSLNGNVVTANAAGVWQVGPFPSGSTVTVTLEHNNPSCDVNLAPQTYTCPPPNDACSGAITINCNSITNGSTQYATADAGTPFCGTSLTSAPGVWYTVTGSGGAMTAALCGSAYDTKIGVFTGTCGSLVCQGGNDDDCGLQSSVSWTSVQGTTYYILVTGYGSSSGAYTLEVVCAGYDMPPCQDNSVTLELQTDGFASETSWDIVPFGNTIPVCSGSGYPNNATVTVDCCLLDGCYDLNVYDSWGDGISLPAGGYRLWSNGVGGERIIDNWGNGDNFTSVSSAGSPFCLPIGTDLLTYASCDRENWTANEFVVATANPAVSAQWGVGDQTDDGYQFWFFDPNGSYNRRIFRNHATSGGFGPPSATRACHVQISSMVTNPVPYDVLLNVRVRSRVNGVYSEFGPACRFLMPSTPPACPTTSLVDNPSNPNFSCGVIKSFGGSDKVWANPVAGANKYRWRFERDGGGFTRVIASNTATLVLSWVTQPLVDGDVYNVTVAASFDNGANYCPYGMSCQVTIDNTPGAQARALETASSFTLFPNPNRGDQVVLNLTDLPEGEVLVTVDILDVFGKRVMSTTEGAQNGSLNLVLALDNSLASGLYTVQVTAGSQTFTERMVINK